jgi:hypothetical protein
MEEEEEEEDILMCPYRVRSRNFWGTKRVHFT